MNATEQIKVLREALAGICVHKNDSNDPGWVSEKFRKIALEALAVTANPPEQATKSTDVSRQLREYAGNPGYSHNDYSDTMRAAADEIERYYSGMLAWKKAAEEKDAASIPQPLEQGPTWQESIIGKEVSLDVSTGDSDAGNRIFGRVEGVNGEIIIAVEESRNFSPAQSPESNPARHAIDGTKPIAYLNTKYRTMHFSNKCADPEEIMALYDHPQEAQRDAERYRWLRHGDNDEAVLRELNGDLSHYLPRNEKLDEAIDAAIAEKKAGA